MMIAKRRAMFSRTLIVGFAALSFLAAQPLASLAQEAPSASPGGAANGSPSAPGPAPGKATQQQLQQLVSPIALYPDMLVAQILAASTYPTEIVEAERWLQDNKNLKGQQLTNAASQQPWDPSVKSLTQYPPVLANMSQNLSWTSALGQAYYNQPSDVMKAIQTLRHMAQQAGTLKSTPQQKVVVENASGGTSAAPTTVTEGTNGNTTIIIQPAQPNVVYVPQYNPTTAYGQPVAAPPGYSSSDLLMTGLMSFGVGLLVGDLIGGSSNNWGCNWHGGNVTYNHNVYISNSNTMPGRWGYHPYGPSHRYYGYGPRYGNNEYPRPYGAYNHPYQAPKMPQQYDQPKYQQDLQHRQNQREMQNAKNAGASGLESHGWTKTPTTTRPNKSFRGYQSQDKRSGQRSWGGSTQPGGFSQAASQRGRDSFSGRNDRWGGGDRSKGRRF
jgi:hypothetical protein